MKLLLIFTWTLLFSGYAAAENSRTSVIKPDGETRISSLVGKSRLAAVFYTRTVNVTENDEVPQFAQCTYSRIPCVLTDQVKLFINKQEISLPRSVFADLGDVHTAKFSTRKGLFVLTIIGGDASEAYIAEVIFSSERVLARRLFSAEDPYHPLQDTQYHQVSTAD